MEQLRSTYGDRVALQGAGLVGFVAACVLAVEKYWLLMDPLSTPSCSIDATASWGPIMSSAQAAVFGFPHSYLGIAGFAFVAAGRGGCPLPGSSPG